MSGAASSGRGSRGSGRLRKKAAAEFDRVAYIRDVSALVAKHANQTVEETPAGIVLYEMIANRRPCEGG